MEWKTPEKPKVGQHRERIVFAWLPVECEDGKTRWFCDVRVLEVLEGGYHGSLGYRPARWTPYKYYRAEVES